MRQIIAFIHPPYFARLLGNTAKRIQFSKFDEREERNRLLNDSKHVFYVTGPDSYQPGAFRQQVAEKATYILVPDELIAFDKYQPKNPFAVLYHSQTQDHRDINIWGKHEQYFCGDHYSNEKLGTPYEEIANQLSTNKITVDRLWETLTIEYIMSARANLIAAVRVGQDLRELSIPPVFSEKRPLIDEFASNVDFKFDGSNQSHRTRLESLKNDLLA